MKTRRLSLQILTKLADAGIQELCVCPGARNAPIVALLERLKGQPDAPIIYTFFEERSAAFFALGRIKATDHPVAVVTTSGTAAGELLPAIMEAHYSELPLVALTADRPRRFRWTGAPQTAEQVGLFGVFVEQSLDLAGTETFDLGKWSRRQPIHLNACSRSRFSGLPKRCPDWCPCWIHGFNPANPRILSLTGGFTVSPHPEKSRRNQSRPRSPGKFLSSVHHPLVLVAALRAEDRGVVAQFLERLGAPITSEAPSGLREHRGLQSLRVHAPESALERASSAGYPIDGILRIGGVPTARLWRDLEDLGGKIPVCRSAENLFQA